MSPGNREKKLRKLGYAISAHVKTCPLCRNVGDDTRPCQQGERMRHMLLRQQRRRRPRPGVTYTGRLYV